ncbi:MAG: TonB-dependent receptor, partial [Gammaproteobacteria bacterium]|nr:TonB-dependent receptor [Gammaproteobacteria bacterium]
HETGPTGNPPFAMDIDWVETNFARLGYATTLGQTRLDVSIGFSDVDHGMSNSEHRPPPASIMRYRANRALAETLTLAVDLSSEFERGDLSYGLDLDLAQMSSTIDNPQNPTFFVEPLPDIDQDRIGAHISWRQDLGAGEMEIGTRIDRHDSKAGLAETGAAVPMMPSMLAMQFNQGSRDWQDTTYDLLARYWMDTDLGTWRFSLARKNRVPTHLERFGWLPIAASAGLADGNNYIGDRQLDPEVAWIVEAGIDLAGGTWWLRPTLFYHRITDYIQGIPFDATVGVADSMVEMVSMMNGDGTPLRFGNVDARMVGMDADFGWQLGQFWRIEGVVSIVRGERRDLGDDLYRISPDRFRLGLAYARSAWSITLEGMAVAAQERVSDTNSEVETAGYGLFNLHGDWKLSESLHISGGIENLFDREYRDHLSGYNRVRNSDVTVGERLPGVGRNVFFRLSWRR